MSEVEIVIDGALFALAVAFLWHRVATTRRRGGWLVGRYVSKQGVTQEEASWPGFLA